MHNNEVVFISTMVGWPASEELWWRTAAILAKQGLSVGASVVECSPTHPRIVEMKAAGINVEMRPNNYSLWRRGLHFLFFKRKSKIVLEVEKLIRSHLPKLVVISPGFPYPPIDLLELCVSRNMSFVTIANGNYEELWPNDDLAERYQSAFRLADCCYFVSKANLHLTEKQIGRKLPNAEIVWSQYNVNFNGLLAWPRFDLHGALNLACVGRLHPAHKGQDILLEALARPVWRDRSWHLTLYGEGPMKRSLQKLAADLDLSERVVFAGHVSVEQIWATNHVLVMPSRCEGMPLALIEAMLCGRPVIGTDVGGIPEIIIDGVTGFLAGPPGVATVAEGLERLWANRAGLEDMGRAAAKNIRERVPADPIGVFSGKIRQLVASHRSSSQGTPNGAKT